VAATCISFTYGATTLALRSSDFIDTRSVTRVQARSRTHDGLLNVGDRELTIIRFTLLFSALSDSDRDAIEDFFGPSKVNGSLNSFTYVDHNGVEYTVRLISDSLVYTNVFTDLWDVDMILEQVAEAGS
jgi:hypothetical protein